MNSLQFFDELIQYPWNQLSLVRGNAHNSAIGFVSLSWIRTLPTRVALDSGPAARKHKGQKGNRYADLLLLDNKKIQIAVEVETGVSKYPEKLRTLLSYFDNKDDFPTLTCGLMLLLNWTGGKNMYQHTWERLKEKVKFHDKPIALISVHKVPDLSFADETVPERVRGEKTFYAWSVNEILGWFHSPELSNPREVVLFP
jgi:hypothetical protein